jgi:hypothetical protein
MKLVKPSSVSEKQTGTTVDTIEFTPAEVKKWKLPPFQRERKFNAKVAAVAVEITKDRGVLPGVLTLGVYNGDTYIVDGQHRLAAFESSGCDTGYADVRTMFATSMAELADEYVRLNSSLVRLRPDDILRGLETSTPALATVRKKCPFVGYDMIRRSDKAPVLSMGTLIRCWMGSRNEVPSTSAPTMEIVAMFTEDEAATCIDFVTLCFEAWGRDVEYARLWSALNLSLCAWLYRRVHLQQNVQALSRAARLTKDEFRKGLMAVSAAPGYTDWLVGRNSSERDRSPAYARVRAAFVQRINHETGKKIQMPQPAWSSRTSGHR